MLKFDGFEEIFVDVWSTRNHLKLGDLWQFDAISGQIMLEMSNNWPIS